MKNVTDNDYIIAIMGVGYIGLPLIEEFSIQKKVIAFDINYDKINNLKKRNKNKNILFTTNMQELSKANVIIVCVSTPVNKNKTPNLKFIKHACEIIGKNITNETIVVFESSYMPTYTENYCIPLIEKYSNKKHGRDFYVGYSPERINPGDSKNTLNTITKLISASDNQTLTYMENLYSQINNINLFKSKNIKVAELSKLVENCQRDINIAFINEISKLCHKLNIDIHDVLDSAETKWNFTRYNPGLVGGDCVGVNSYYLMQLANKYDIDIESLKTARHINTSMEIFISDELEKILGKVELTKKIKISIYGYTYKENISDTRNSRIKYLYKELKSRNFQVKICDYNVDTSYNTLVQNEDLMDSDVIILAVPHYNYSSWNIDEITKRFNKNSNKKIFMDIKSVYKNLTFTDIEYWRL